MVAYKLVEGATLYALSVMLAHATFSKVRGFYLVVGIMPSRTKVRDF